MKKQLKNFLNINKKIIKILIFLFLISIFFVYKNNVFWYYIDRTFIKKFLYEEYKNELNKYIDKNINKINDIKEKYNEVFKILNKLDNQETIWWDLNDIEWEKKIYSIDNLLKELNRKNQIERQKSEYENFSEVRKEEKMEIDIKTKNMLEENIKKSKWIIFLMLDKKDFIINWWNIYIIKRPIFIWKDKDLVDEDKEELKELLKKLASLKDISIANKLVYYINKKFWNIITTYSYKRFFNSINFNLKLTDWDKINLNSMYWRDMSIYNNLYYTPYLWKLNII